MKIPELAELPSSERQDLITRFLPPKTKDGFETCEPIGTTDDGYGGLLKLHTAACLTKKAERGLRELLEDPKTHAGLLRAAAMIGSYNPKMPNANVAALPLFAREPGDAAALPPGASSRTTPCFRRVGSAGNAADAAYMAFLAKEFVIDGQTRSVAEDFARRGPLWAAAIAEGLPQAAADGLAERLKNRLDKASDEPIDRFLKQLFWPTQDGGYCLISPVQSFGMLGEAVLRIDEATRKQQHVVPREYTKVAGANPINAGQLNAEIAGLHPHLLCQPPPRRDTSRHGEDRFQAQLAGLAGQGVFHPGALSGHSVEKLKAAIADPRENAEAKRRYAFNLALAAREAVRDARELAERLQAEEPCRLLEERYAKVPDALKAWLDPRSVGLPEDAALDDGLLQGLAAQAYEAVFAKLGLVGKNDLQGAELRSALIKAIREAL